MNKQYVALISSTCMYAICIAAWTLLSILAIQIMDNTGLSNAQCIILIVTPILSGAVNKMLLGILADKFGRIIAVIAIIITSFSTYALSISTTYEMQLLAAVGIGFAGGVYSVGTVFVSNWASKEKQGTFLGIFGIGMAGTSITSFCIPFLLSFYSWNEVARIYALILIITALIFWITTKDKPSIKHSVPLSNYFVPLKDSTVWRFSLAYLITYGSFMALTMWLPRYYMSHYGVDLKTAGMLTALFALPGGIFRAFGGILADKFGSVQVKYIAFTTCLACAFVLSYPNTDFIIYGIKNEMPFSINIKIDEFATITFILATFMSFGMSAIYKDIPILYPHHIGAIGGVVGFIGTLGGALLPIAFSYLNEVTNIWSSCFMLLFLLITISLTWMHLATISTEQKERQALQKLKH